MGRTLGFASIFVVTYATYFLAYSARTNAAVVKKQLSAELQLSDIDLGVLDSCFLASYLVSTLFLSSLLDSLDSWLVLDVCVLAVGLASGLIAATDESAPALLTWARLCFAHCLNGAAQSLVYPSALSSLRSCGGRVSATALAVWCSASAAGGLAGRTLAAYATTTFGWRAAFAIPAMLNVFVGCLLPLLHTGEIGKDAKRPAKTKVTIGHAPSSRSTALSPHALLAGFMYGCAKCVRYAFALWLPLLHGRTQANHASTTGRQSALFDIGNLSGSLLAGALADAVPGGPAYSAGPLAVAAFGALAILLPVLGAPLTASTGGDDSMRRTATLAHIMLVTGAASGAAETLSGPISLAVLTAAACSGSGTIAGVVNTLGALGALAAAPLPARLGLEWDGLCQVLGLVCGTAAAIGAAAQVASRRRVSAPKVASKTD